jgi:chaperonin GroES
MSDKQASIDSHDPDYYRPSSKGLTEKEYKNKQKEQWANVKDQYMISPILGGDGRVLVQEDPHKDKFECKDCKGTGCTSETCPYCLGSKYDRGKEENGECRDCTSGEGPLKTTFGKVLCSTCHGTRGTIVIPDESKRNTTTGDILAISRDGIRQVKVGDKVMFTNYTGSQFKFLDIDFRIVVEKDLLALVKQLKSNVESLNEGSFADLVNTGTPHE